MRRTLSSASNLPDVFRSDGCDVKALSSCLYRVCSFDEDMMKTMICAVRIHRGKLGRDARSSKRRERLIYAFTPLYHPCLPAHQRPSS